MVKKDTYPVAPKYIVLKPEWVLGEDGKWQMPTQITVSYEQVVALVPAIGEAAMPSVSEIIPSDGWDAEVAQFVEAIANRFEALAVDKLGCDIVAE